MTESELAKFKKWLVKVLQTGPTTVKFVKRDGSKRTMNCTLQADLIPQTVNSQSKERKVSTEILSVYDLENKAWKSFRWDSLKEVIITI